jgi:hypothetical protein
MAGAGAHCHALAGRQVLRLRLLSTGSMRSHSVDVTACTACWGICDETAASTTERCFTALTATWTPSWADMHLSVQYSTECITPLRCP